MGNQRSGAVRQVPTCCYNCVSGPDLLTVKVENGVAIEIGLHFAGAGMHPSDGKPCVKAYGLIQKTYNPHRILTPMKRGVPRRYRAGRYRTHRRCRGGLASA